MNRTEMTRNADELKDASNSSFTRDKISALIALAHSYELNFEYALAESSWKHVLSVYKVDQKLYEKDRLHALRKVSDLCCAQGKYEEAAHMLSSYIKGMRRLFLMSNYLDSEDGSKSNNSSVNNVQREPFQADSSQDGGLVELRQDIQWFPSL